MKKDIEVKQCMLCMEYHDLEIIEDNEKTIFKNEEIEFTSKLCYCKSLDEYYETEELMRENNKRLKDAYRLKVGLLTSASIKEIRNKYNLSQKELAKVFDWGEKTITRYESYQVQDRAHDDLLLCVKENPIYLYNTVNKNKEKIGEKTYNKAIKDIKKYLHESKDNSLRNSIIADYIEYPSTKYQGDTVLDLNKIIETINYIAKKVKNLYTVKLMKILWYIDNLHYKNNDIGITGLKYFKETMGALPKGYERIIMLDGISKEMFFANENLCNRFIESDFYQKGLLSFNEKKTINLVIEKLGELSTNEIVNRMHEEEAYLKTEDKHLISYDYSKYIEI